MDTSGPWTRASRATGLLSDPGGPHPARTARPTVFARISALAAQHDAANLGQGFPDTDPPPLVAEAAIEAIRAGRNQYPPGAGEAVLREAVAEHQQRCYGLGWDPHFEVLVTTGATEALAATVLALVEPGDEVITLEPFYDQYAALIALAGGVHRTVPLAIAPGADGDLVTSVDTVALRAAFGDRTRMIIVNSPHNPTGLVLGREVLTVIAEEAAHHDALIVTDEVYEHLTYGSAHVPIAALPGARERTVSISSAGKTFSVTGWKIGWVTAPAELITAITGVKQWLTYTSGAPFQPAVAAGLRMPASVVADIAADLRSRRDLLVEGLRSVGFTVSVPGSGYFVVADAAPLGETDAEALCERLPREAQVAAIPLSAFYRPAAAPPEAPAAHPHGSRPGPAPEAASLLRFAFCKDRATIEQAIERLGAWAAR